MEPDTGNDADASAESTGSYYIQSGSPAVEPWPRVLKHGDSFALFDHFGDISSAADVAMGFYHRDTRMLSEWRLLVDGRRPLLLSSTVRENNSALMADLTNPDLYDGERLRQPRDTLHIVRTIFLWDRGCHQRIALRNYGEARHRNVIRLEFDADFVDLFEVRGHRPARRGRRSPAVASGARVELHYTASDGQHERTVLQFEPLPAQVDEQAVEWPITLAPGERCSLFVSVSVGAAPALEAGGSTFLTAMRTSRNALRRASGRAASIESSNEIFNEIVRRSIADLYMLMTDTGDGPYPYAGVPWFSTPFGRDGIITALEMLWIDPEVARGVLRFLARTQARHTDPQADAEPGKILHEMRHGELARTGEVPFLRYYGSVDATPLFVLLAGLYHERTGDAETLEALWPSIEAALAWIDGPGDPDGDGLLEYRSQRPDGLVNQGWKDSADAVFHDDGRLAEGPIALVEVQGYVYAAKRAVAEAARALGKHADAERLVRQADALRERVETMFWSDSMYAYVLALDGAKRPCLVRSSNAGHLLLAGVASRPRAERLAADLLGRAFFSGWGIRTVPAGEPRYNPMSYHNGSIWPHDNALIALGLARYGYTDAVQDVFAGLFEAATFMELRRLPELFCGFRRKAGQGPTFYPTACSPQAWAAAAPLALLQASLGLTCDTRNRAVVLHHPRLPPFLDEVCIRNLRLDSASIDLLCRRHGDDVAVNVLRRDGDVAVDVRI